MEVVSEEASKEKAFEKIEEKVMKLILTRHGQTFENLLGVVQGHLQGKLSPEGRKQIKKLAVRLKNERIDFIYSSDLERAKDTTKEIVKFHQDTPIKYTSLVKERNWGPLQGLPKEEFRKLAYDKKYVEAAAKRGEIESLAHITERASKFLDKLLHEHSSKTVLVVSHGGFAGVLISLISGKEYTQGQLNTAVNIFELKEDKNHKILLLNSAEHLETLSKNLKRTKFTQGCRSGQTGWTQDPLA